MSKNNIDLSLIARGPHKKAIQENGLTLIKNDKSENFKLKVTDDPKELGIQDYIFISVKAHAISNIVESLQSLIGENTTIISAVNGLPWWYFHKADTGTNLDEKHIDCVDPDGKIWNSLKPSRALGCVAVSYTHLTLPTILLV